MNDKLSAADWKRKGKSFFVYFKNDRRRAAAAVFILVSILAVLAPTGTWFFDRIGFDPGRWLGRPAGESLRDIFKRVADKDKEKLPDLRRAVSPAGKGLEYVASGSFGSWNTDKKLPQPKSVYGIMNAGEALDRPEGVHVDGETAQGSTGRGSGSFDQGKVPAYVGKALTGPGGAAGPTIDESLLGMASPAQAQAEAAGASQRGSRYSISRGELRGFLTNDVDVDAVVSRRIVGQGGGNSAAHQLAQVKVTTKRYETAGALEGKSMAGAAYEKHKIPLRSITGSGEATPVHTTFPDMNPDDGMTRDISETAACVQAAERVRSCSKGKTTEFLQLTRLTDQLSDLSVQLAISCGDKCPSECGPCVALGRTQTRICAEMNALIAKINKPCIMPDGCFSDINPMGGGKSIVPRASQLGDCAVKHVCGESNSYWGKVYCNGQEMIDTLTGGTPRSGGCSSPNPDGSCPPGQ